MFLIFLSIAALPWSIFYSFLALLQNPAWIMSRASLLASVRWDVFTKNKFVMTRKRLFVSFKFIATQGERVLFTILLCRKLCLFKEFLFWYKKGISALLPTSWEGFYATSPWCCIILMFYISVICFKGCKACYS